MFELTGSDYIVEFTTKPTDTVLQGYGESLSAAGFKTSFSPKSEIVPGFELAAKLKIENSLADIADKLKKLKGSEASKDASAYRAPK